MPNLKDEVDKPRWSINVDALRYKGEFREFLKLRIWEKRKKAKKAKSK